MAKFKLKSDFNPAGDQPRAIEAMVSHIKKGIAHRWRSGFSQVMQTCAM